LLQLECDLGGHLRDLVSKVGQIVVHVSGIAARKAASSSAPPGARRLAMAPNIGLPRRLHVICHEMVGDLATHRISDLQRIAEMNAAPDAHLFVFLGHLRKAGELA
jgi:hypothetical protein